MSGHSKWSTIKRAKGVADIKRGLTFTKIANAITIASRLGGVTDPETNPRLRMAIEEARKVNMPKSNIQRAIDRGLGKLPGQLLEEVIYEGFGPSKVALLLEAVTDNKNRATSEVRNILERAGGNLAGQGSVAYMFIKVGQIMVETKGGDKDTEILELIDLGVEDFEEVDDEKLKYLVYTSVPELNTMISKLIVAGYKILESGLTLKPNIFVDSVSDMEINKVVELVEKLENLDDIQKVYHNLSLKN